MADMKDAILDAKYVEMISLADFIVRDCGMPDMTEDGEPLPQANEVAAAIFRWAAGLETYPEEAEQLPETEHELEPKDDTSETSSLAEFQEYDEHGDPILPVEEAERLEAMIQSHAPREVKH